MSEKQQKPGSPEDGNPKPKSPKGFGGVVLILALLLALFVVVSSSGMDGDDSEDAFLRRLFRGQIVTTTWAEGVVSAEYRVPPKDGKEVPNRHMEVVLREFPKDDVTRYFHPLAGKPMDTRYQGSDGLGRLYHDVVTGKIEVTDAIFVQEVPGTSVKADKDPEAEPLEPSAYVVAFAQIGNEIVHLFSEPKGGDQEIAVPLLDESGEPILVDGQEQTRTVAVNLQVLRRELTGRETPIRDWTLSLSSDSFQVKEPNTALIYVLSSVVPWILVLLIVWFFILRQMRSPGGGGGVLSFGRSRAALYTKENRTNITFGDVAGMEEAKNEVKEIIEFLKNPAKFAKLGGSIPRGVLLVGSPGTGKTLLAKAIAGEAEVPFFSISGSDFVEMFVGVGASRVRDLFKQAREASPCIVFLDEIDAVGRKRGTGMGGGHDEREQTLNAILVEMDGFDSDKGIILLGATNRPDVLDPALLRPGRFDRQVVIDMPDVKGREAILKVHARKVKLAPTVDLTVVARATAGFSGAELAAVINEGAILAAMKGQDSVTLPDLEEARDRVRWGREKRSRAIEEEDKRVTAYHEAGHALVSVLLGDQDPIHKVTIVSRGRSLGATLSLPEKDDYNHWCKKLKGRIAMCYGGRIAEDVVFSDVSAGAQNDIEQASRLARVMVCELGMSEKVGPIKYTMDQEANYLGSEMRLAADISPKTMEVIDEEVRRLIDEAYVHAKELIVDNREMLDSIAAALLKHETISGEEISVLMRGDDLDEYRAAQARQEAEAHREAEAATKRKEEDKPDVDLSGAEGLAHP